MRLVIFDCDGTIADSQHAIVSAMAAAYEEFGLAPPSRDAVLKVVGLSLEGAIEQLLDCPEARAVGAGKLAVHYKLAFQSLRGQPGFSEPLFPGLHDLILDLASQGATLLGVATGKSNRGLHNLLDTAGLVTCFQTLQTADDNPSKPNPEMILRALAATGCDPDRTVMVGDTTFDIEMARLAGVRAIGVTWGYHDAETLEACEPDAMVSDAGELRAAIDRLVAPVQPS